MLVVKRHTECRTTGRTGQNGVVPVAAGEDELIEVAEAAGRGPVAARVEVRVEEEDIELGLVLHRALHPAELVLEVLGWLGDELSGDLDGPQISCQPPFGTNVVGGDPPRQS